MDKDKDKNKNAPPSPTSASSKSDKSEKKEPLSLEELLAKKKAEELARSKVCVFFSVTYSVSNLCKNIKINLYFSQFF